MVDILGEMCDGTHPHCGCVIDLSTPATLERDFHAWLEGLSPSPSNTECSSADYSGTEYSNSEYSMEYAASDFTSIHTMAIKMEPIEECENLSETQPKVEDGRKTRRKGGTNLYGRPYCPGRPLSMEERTRIIELHMTGMKVNAISKTLCISHGCVSKIISRYRQTGILSPASSPEQRRSRRKKSEMACSENVIHNNSLQMEMQHHYVIAP